MVQGGAKSTKLAAAMFLLGLKTSQPVKKHHTCIEVDDWRSGWGFAIRYTTGEPLTNYLFWLWEVQSSIAKASAWWHLLGRYNGVASHSCTHKRTTRCNITMNLVVSCFDVCSSLIPRSLVTRCVVTSCVVAENGGRDLKNIGICCYNRHRYWQLNKVNVQNNSISWYVGGKLWCT